MSAHAYSHAVVRVVPRVERGEFVNAGVVVHCHARRFLDAAFALDAERLRALWPAVDVDVVESHLRAFACIARGGAAGGPVGLLPAQQRFAWLVAPRSTIIQCSPSHAGLCDDPAAELRRLVGKLVHVDGR